MMVVIVWAGQEWAWNVYPSTSVSSAMVVSCLALQTLFIWMGTSAPRPRQESTNSTTKSHSE